MTSLRFSLRKMQTATKTKTTKTPKTKTTTFTLDLAAGRRLAEKHGPIVQKWLDAEEARLNAEVTAYRKQADAALEACANRLFAFLGLDPECDEEAMQAARDRCLAKGGPRVRKVREMIDTFKQAERFDATNERAFQRQFSQLNAEAHKRLQAAIVAEMRATKTGVSVQRGTI